LRSGASSNTRPTNSRLRSAAIPNGSLPLCANSSGKRGGGTLVTIS
jgi:hypothetical protein